MTLRAALLAATVSLALAAGAQAQVAGPMSQLGVEETFASLAPRDGNPIPQGAQIGSSDLIFDGGGVTKLSPQGALSVMPAASGYAWVLNTLRVDAGANPTVYDLTYTPRSAGTKTYVVFDAVETGCGWCTFYVMSTGPGGGSLQKSVDNGGVQQVTTLATWLAGAPANTYKVSVSQAAIAAGANFRVAANGVQLLGAGKVDPNPLPGGRFGFIVGQAGSTISGYGVTLRTH
jgi:hypothetical protein